MIPKYVAVPQIPERVTQVPKIEAVKKIVEVRSTEAILSDGFTHPGTRNRSLRCTGSRSRSGSSSAPSRSLSRRPLC